MAIRNSREPPLFFVVDEQINPYHGKMSVAKKRLPKKEGVGLEYNTIATSNKYYEGYREEKRGPPTESEIQGKLIRADPVSGGIKLNYTMDTGPRYVGTSNPS